MALIFTTKGEIEESLLTTKKGSSENESEIISWKEYYLGEELVKRDVHLHLKQGIEGVSFASF